MKAQPPGLAGAALEVMRQLTAPAPRRCGSCQVCCKLVPVAELAKQHNTRCQHQRHGKGCAIYETRPKSCARWTCGWLDGFDLPRPDHGHYVVDGAMDVISTQEEGQPERFFDCVQVWVDPAHPDAWKCPRLAALLDTKRVPAIIRYEERLGFTLWPPSISSDGQWHRTAPEVPNARQGEIQARREAAEGAP